MVEKTDNKDPDNDVTVKKSGTEVDVAKKDESRALHPFDEMDRLFENLFARNWLRSFRWDLPALDDVRMPFGGKVPRVDVIDNGKDVVIRAEIPGVNKKDLDITMTDNSVTIKGSTKKEEKEKKDDYFRSEISKGSFSRTVALPDNVDATKAKASFTDGLLELIVPKIKATKRHSIKVE